MVLVLIGGTAMALMTFPGMRQLGASLLVDLAVLRAVVLVATLHAGLGRGAVGGNGARLECDVATGRDVAAGRRGLLFLFALGEGAPWRLLGTRVAGRDGRPGAPVPDGELQQLIDDAGIRARLTGVAWSARVRLQHRVADRYRRGRVFLAGDAAHASSPAGGQGVPDDVWERIGLTADTLTYVSCRGGYIDRFEKLANDRPLVDGVVLAEAWKRVKQDGSLLKPPHVGARRP